MMTGTYVYCQTRFEGFHQWPEAPEEVSYLREMHRHEFRVKVVVKVNHDNRDVEFITLKNHTNQIIKTGKSKGGWTGQLSCEQIANAIIGKLLDRRYQVHSVEVSEDGENGSIVVC